MDRDIYPYTPRWTRDQSERMTLRYYCLCGPRMSRDPSDTSITLTRGDTASEQVQEKDTDSLARMIRARSKYRISPVRYISLAYESSIRSARSSTGRRITPLRGDGRSAPDHSWQVQGQSPHHAGFSQWSYRYDSGKVF
jgi:hypothetical protein